MYVNFLEQGQRGLESSGAMQGIDPVDAYRKAAALRLIKGKELENELDTEEKMYKIIQNTVQRATSPDDLNSAARHYKTKFGDSPMLDSIPEDYNAIIGKDKKYETMDDFKMDMLANIGDKIKLKKGGAVKVFEADEQGNPKIRNNAFITDEMTQGQIDGWAKQGIYFRSGTPHGTPKETAEESATRVGKEESARIGARTDTVSEPYFDDDMQGWYQKKDDGTIHKIKDTEGKQDKPYVPQSFVDKEGNISWIRPGEPVPKGLQPWTASEGKDKTPVFDTPEEAVRKGEPFAPKGKTTVPKPALGGYTFSYEGSGEKVVKPGEAYKAWEGTVDRRMSQTMKKYGLTDVQAGQISAGTADMASILAEMLAKKKLTKEGAAAMNKELGELENIRDKGLDEIEAGGNPYKHLKKAKEAAKTPEMAVSHGGVTEYEYRNGTLTKKKR